MPNADDGYDRAVEVLVYTAGPPHNVPPVTPKSYVIVRVWVSRIRKTSPGHTSLAIRPLARDAAQGYVSFAPVKSGVGLWTRMLLSVAT